MNVRPFEWRDLPTLHRYRNECVFLDSSLMLTRGPIFVPTGVLLSTLAHATGLFTFLVHEEQTHPVCIGQIMHTAGLGSAQLTFITPQSALSSQALAGMFEHMAGPVGERGAMHILAEAEDQSEALSVLRQVGFGIYARQRIWRLTSKTNGRSIPSGWRSAGKQDEAAIRFLYANLVPGLVQQMETLPEGRPRGLVYYRGTELLAYADLEYGLNGILAQPFIHPDAEALPEMLLQLLLSLPDLYSRPVYVCVRSYQSWLEAVLQQHVAEPILYQAVLVRHLAVTRRALQPLAAPAMNGSTPEPTIPVAQIKTK
jgi:hypothetical protein